MEKFLPFRLLKKSDKSFFLPPKLLKKFDKNFFLPRCRLLHLYRSRREDVLYFKLKKTKPRCFNVAFFFVFILF